MRKFAIAIVVCAASTVLGANFWITEAQSYVINGLTELKFESVPAPGGVVGGPQRFRVTQKTVDHLRNLANTNKTIIVENDGSITVK
ncbi:MAG TPA: hypothetical protein VGI40_27660 [Pirellulaceae bacterium]|jgi:hypothetical protein